MADRVIWSPLAEKDLDEILNYLIINWNTHTTIKFLDKIEKVITQILKNPNQFPLVNKGLEIRKCVVTKHNTLFYRSHDNIIHILRLYDVRQNPDKLMFE